VQGLCARTRHRAFCFSRLHLERLLAEGHDGGAMLLEGLYAGGESRASVADARPLVVFAGRHIPEKRVPALLEAFARARAAAPELRCEIYGDGPERSGVLRGIAALGLDGAVEAPGFVDDERIDVALRHALCMVTPSRREGYGLVVVEAAARGTPSVVVRGPDNAAVELVVDGENGVVADSADPDELAAAILRVRELGPSLRKSTAAWFERNAQRLSLETSLEKVLGEYSASR
jgi:glycosyltransferase involved in cell wall biosynthesis